ncbi:Uncharacterised protein [Vibrio cholerae]|nr:Uncharacterised protein [Vibrio cholerae]
MNIFTNNTLRPKQKPILISYVRMLRYFLVKLAVQ